MRHLSEFVAVAPQTFSAGQVTPVNLHIFMPLNKTIVFFRRTGDQLTDEDCAKMSALPRSSLLVHRSEKETLNSFLGQGMAGQLKGSSTLSEAPALKQGAASVLQNIQTECRPGEGASNEGARQLLHEASRIVENIMGGLEKTPSLRTYETILKSIKSGNQDPVLTHNQQVSAIAVLIRLSAGPDSLFGVLGDSHENLAAIGAAALMHDMGLLALPRPLVEKHLIGEDELTASEKIIYMKHIELSREMISSTGISVTDETLHIIDQHHENYDGTGFRGTEGNLICYAARIIRIADDVVSCINHPANTFGFREALGHLHWKERRSKVTAYDPAIMNLLGDLK